MSDQQQIVLIAAAWSTIIALIGLSVLWAARRWSLRVLVPGMAVVGAAAALAAMYGAARAMFVSQHDFTVMIWVLGTAGVVTVICAMAAGITVARWSQGLQDDVAQIMRSGRLDPSVEVPAELRDVSRELARTSADLRRAREHEIHLEESRRELIAWISHDLRSPLAGTRAMAEALEDGVAEDPARYHRQIRTEADRMARMVDDLFELSRINAGLLRLNTQQVVLGDLISETLASAYPVASSKKVHLAGSVNDQIEVLLDPAEMSRVLINLVMNAIRHTPQDGAVHIAGRSDRGLVELTVTDGCGGLSSEELGRVFDVSWQSDRARTPEMGSTFGPRAGLGLAIARGIVEAHSGTISVANHPPGCRFLVQLPRSG